SCSECYPSLCSGFVLACAPTLRHLRSFPTRRSSDLAHREPQEEGRDPAEAHHSHDAQRAERPSRGLDVRRGHRAPGMAALRVVRSEEHTSELQSRGHLVCRLLLEKKKKQTITSTT